MCPVIKASPLKAGTVITLPASQGGLHIQSQAEGWEWLLFLSLLFVSTSLDGKTWESVIGWPRNIHAWMVLTLLVVNNLTESFCHSQTDISTGKYCTAVGTVRVGSWVSYYLRLWRWGQIRMGFSESRSLVWYVRGESWELMREKFK